MTRPSDLINLGILRWICEAKINDFDQFGVRTDTPDGSYIYADRGPQAKILGVAHRDTVCPAKHFKYDRERERIVTPTLDDRLGCAIVMSVLPKIIPYSSFDILLTEGEETGRSTARYFKQPDGKEYNWMFSFDRGGVDAVHYQYTDPLWMTALKDLNCEIEHGSLSDICYLESLGVCGVNVGCAYYQYHSPRAYCKLEETVDAVERFADFFDKYKDIRFEHDAENYGRSGKIFRYPQTAVPSHTRWANGVGWVDRNGNAVPLSARRRWWDEDGDVDDDESIDESLYEDDEAEEAVETALAETGATIEVSAKMRAGQSPAAALNDLALVKKARKEGGVKVARNAWKCSWCAKPVNVLMRRGEDTLCDECDKFAEQGYENHNGLLVPPASL